MKKWKGKEKGGRKDGRKGRKEKGALANGVIGMFDLNCDNGFMDVYMSNVSNGIL